MGLNAYRLIGDFSHLFAIFILYIKILHSRSVFGISGKSLILFGLTYTTRYLDIFTFISIYNSVFKGFYLLSIYFLIYLTHRTFKESYQKECDTFWISLLIFPAVILAIFINHVEYAQYDDIWPYLMEVAWTFSIYLEAVAIVPQLYMIWKFGNTDAFLILYLIAMATYRGMYIGNWVYRYRHENFYDMIAVIGGIIETLVGILGLTLVISLKIWGACLQQKKDMSIYNVTPDFEYTFMKKGFNFSNNNGNQAKMGQVQVPQVQNGETFKVEMETECQNLEKIIDQSKAKNLNKK